jgi:hypothetical protein
VLTTDYPSTGVDVSVMGADGTLAAPVTLTDKALPVSNQITVGLGSGRSLLVYSRLFPESNLGNYQVRFQILDTTTPADGGTTVLDAGTDRAADASDGGVTSTDDASDDAAATDAARDGAAIADAADAPAMDRPPSTDAADADLRLDASGGMIDGAAADRGAADDGKRLGGSGCSCAVAAGRGAGWSSILVALVLLRSRRRRRPPA